MPGKASLKRDVMSGREKMWYVLQHGIPKLRIVKRARDDVPPGMRCYLEYIITDKEYDDINWDTTDET